MKSTIIILIVLANLAEGLRCISCVTFNKSVEEAKACRDGALHFSRQCSPFEDTCIKTDRYNTSEKENNNPEVLRTCSVQMGGTKDLCRAPLGAWGPTNDLNCYCYTDNCNMGPKLHPDFRKIMLVTSGALALLVIVNI